ncbi:MAG: hypothetical protein ABL309_13930 [Phycisphaerales bacterium]
MLIPIPLIAFLAWLIVFIFLALWDFVEESNQSVSAAFGYGYTVTSWSGGWFVFGVAVFFVWGWLT